MTNPPKSPNSRPIALITGASVGIGYELAKQFAANGHDLIIVARDRARLETVKMEIESTFGVQVELLAKDLSLPSTPDEIFQEVSGTGVALDVLVNNAGFGTNGPFAAADLRKELKQVQVNVTSVVHLTGLFLPGMVERGTGKILTVASTAAFQPGPFMAVYYATKAFDLFFCEALASELQGTGVHVTTLCAGPTRTEFQTRAGMKEAKLAGDTMMMEASAVAKIGYDALMKKKVVVIPGVKNRLLAFSQRFMPRSFVRRVVRGLNMNRNLLA